MQTGMPRSRARRQISAAGKITAVDGTRLTILRADGETQTIQVDENTSFRKQGESVTLADLKPEDKVFGRGEVKNGVFVPTVLNVGEPRPMRTGSQKDWEQR